MSKKDIDIDKEIEKLSRKTNVEIKKMEYSFENQVRKLDAEIDNVMNEKLKEFDENKELTSKYLTTNYKTDTVNIYRERLKKI